MIKKIIRRIKIFSIIVKLSKKEPNDYSFGYKVRKIITLYREGKEIDEKEIFNEKIKP
jgi:hypothetical protein